uniref:Uncharacterized protein n=1 Tax=Octopus bimaculoides TaxID=37653 RepID=A0A0L8HQ19_OCTBM
MDLFKLLQIGELRNMECAESMMYIKFCCPFSVYFVVIFFYAPSLFQFFSFKILELIFKIYTSKPEYISVISDVCVLLSLSELLFMLHLISLKILEKV